MLMSLWKGEISALPFIHLLILQPDGGMCNTGVPARTPLLYCFTRIISLCLAMWVKLYFKKKKKKKTLALLLGGLEGALLCAKGDELLFVRCVVEGLWRE